MARATSGKKPSSSGKSRTVKAKGAPRTPRLKAPDRTGRAKDASGKREAVNPVLRRALARYLREDVTVVLIEGQHAEEPSPKPRKLRGVTAHFPRDRRVAIAREVYETMEDLDTALIDPSRPPTPVDDGALWRNLMLTMMPGAMLDALAELVECKDLRTVRENALSSIGHIVSVAVRRAILRRALTAYRWSLTSVAQLLRLGGTGNLLRAIKDAGLEDELIAARAKGLVKRGGDRRGSKRK